jgi:hypothetical protein
MPLARSSGGEQVAPEHRLAMSRDLPAPSKREQRNRAAHCHLKRLSRDDLF